MFDLDMSKKISDFVYIKPRTVDEIAKHIGKNWRTADRYVKRISEEQGTISMRTFREGTKGALKLVFWNNIEKIHSSTFQERLFYRITRGIRKSDFSPFDIYQHIGNGKKVAHLFEQERKMFAEFVPMLKQAEKQVLFFSGNLSWVKQKGFIEALEELAKRKVIIKIITRIDYTGIENIRAVLGINNKVGRTAIEIKHKEQPLRGAIIDNKLVNFKEVKDPVFNPSLKKKSCISYQLFDKDWIEWLQKVFWHMFADGIGAEKRFEEIDTIHKILD
ncbi:hypothetical protein ACFLZZ_00060 [Nanoarchaeota archaeon]